MSKFAKLLIVMGIMALVLVVMVAGALGYLGHRVTGKFAKVEIGKSIVAKDPSSETVNFLLMGTDTRLNASNRADWAKGGSRTDALMLAQLSSDKNYVTVMSIPRDSWVEIPGHGKAKINAAFAYGGPSLAVQTVEKLTGVHIDHFAIVNFESFTSVTDKLGGVQVQTMDGLQSFDGKDALAYVRERHSLARGDFDRVQRQQAWLRGIMKKLFTSEVLTSPRKALGIAETIAEDVTVDSALGNTEILKLAYKMKATTPAHVRFITAPVRGVGTSDDGQSIVQLNDDALAQLMVAWREDRLEQYLDSGRAETDSLRQNAP